MLTKILAKLSGVTSETGSETSETKRGTARNGAGETGATPATSRLKLRQWQRYPYSLDEALLWFSGTPWTIRHAVEGVSILGDMGSGKSSASGATLARAYLKAGWGGLVLCKKADECATWQRYAKETGRSKSLLIVHPASGWRFNLVDYQLTRAGEGAGFTENAVNMFMHLVENRRDAHGGSDKEQRFFVDNARRLLRHLFESLLVAGERVTMPNLQLALESLPQPNPNTGKPTWHQPSYLAECLAQAIDAQQAGKALPYAADPMALRRYFEQEFARTGSDRQSAGIISTLTGMADPFMTGPMLELFGGVTNFTPEYSREGAIILLNLPLDEYEEIGRTAALAFKYVWQRAILRRQGLPQGEVPVFLWADEAANFLTSADRSFQEACRSSLCSTVFLSQNINNYIAALGGGPQGEANAYGIFAGLGTKIFHRNGDERTNEWAAKTIAKALTRRASVGSSQSMQSGRTTSASDRTGRRGGRQRWNDSQTRNSSDSVNQGYQEAIEFQIEPELFTRLTAGGERHGGRVQAILFRSGEAFAGTGKPFTGVTFMQG